MLYMYRRECGCVCIGGSDVTDTIYSYLYHHRIEKQGTNTFKQENVRGKGWAIRKRKMVIKARERVCVCGWVGVIIPCQKVV